MPLPSSQLPTAAESDEQNDYVPDVPNVTRLLVDVRIAAFLPGR